MDISKYTLASQAFAAPEMALDFMLAGKAVATIRSNKSGNHFTYQIAPHPEAEEDAGILLVKVLAGPDNTKNFRYIGFIKNKGEFVWGGSKAKMPRNGASVEAFIWAYNHLRAKSLPESLSVFHMSRCGRCSRRLTVPSSIESGFGPECVKYQTGGK